MALALRRSLPPIFSLTLFFQSLTFAKFSAICAVVIPALPFADSGRAANPQEKMACI
jgi:hypothetical protein